MLKFKYIAYVGMGVSLCHNKENILCVYTKKVRLLLCQCEESEKNHFNKNAGPRWIFP